ncbi:MAG: ABC transporter ATP-binding protein [Anaerolineales bacterium]|nr:MAG: ABC transporter ATP-binding protein [Anaerolineales bacterium]
MLHGGFGGARRLMEQESTKPRRVSATLARLARYAAPYGLVLIAVAALIVGNTYTQVKAPELAGQAVDCFLVPATAARLGAQGAAMPEGLSGMQTSEASATSSSCWYAQLGTAATTQDYIGGLGRLVLVIVGLYVGGALMNGLVFLLMSWAGQHVLRTLRSQVFHHLHRLSLSYYAERQAGAIMSRITNDMETLQQVINFALVSVVSGALLVVWVAAKMLSLSLGYAVLSMVVVPLMLVATVWLSGQARKAFRRTRLEIGRVSANLEESISGVREVQAFSREGLNIEAFRASNAANRDANIRAVSFTAALSPTLEALGYLAVAVVAIVGGYVLLRGQTLLGTTVSLGLIIAFIAYVQQFNRPIAQISVLWTNLQSAVAGAERIFELLDTVPDLQDKPGAQEMPPIQGRVQFEDVCAYYVEGEMVLENVSFVAEAGQTVAIVGPTGAGKTTIINLIPRFYDVKCGEIRIDDINVADVTRESLRKQIGIVLQDTFLFSDTVTNNIRFGRPEASEEEVQAAAKLAHADDFIQRLPKGYDTVLGEQGAGLSHGQRQLIAIARAALTDPRILILDEATSSVDTRTERLIQKALEQLLRGRTSFVIAHRLSTIRNADQVLVILDGKIVERGTHKSLLEARGAYYDLYMRQFREEDLEEGQGRLRDLEPSLAASK